MNEKEFKSKFNEKREYVETLLKKYLPPREGYQRTIFEAMEYSLMGGGKRIRPILMGESYELFGGKDAAIIEPFMAAMEMIHTYSLVHDDLPAMDNDEYRRGRQTTHVVYGEDMGILTGDALLNYAYETVAGCFQYTDNLPQMAEAFRILAKKAGVFGMVGGQVVDVEQTGKELSEDMLCFIDRLKTSALLEASLMAGAALAGASSDELNILEQIGYKVGMAFQIQDDLLDVTSTTEELGKPVHSDEDNHKTTYVTVYGLERAREAVSKYSEEAISLLHSLDRENDFLEELLNRLADRKK